MHLESLEVHRFRNLQTQEIVFNDRVCLFVGNNGQGKTSVLESIFVLSHAKSFRTSKMSELVQWTNEKAQSQTSFPCSLKGLIRTESGKKSLKCEIEHNRRQVFLNDTKVTSASNFYGQLTSVVFTPDELQLVKGPPALRRKFVDRTLAMVDRAYVDSLVAYQRALKSRNSLLVDLRKSGRGQEDRELRAILSPWDSLIVQHGSVIARKRDDLRRELEMDFLSYYDFLCDSGKPLNEKISCQFDSDFYDDDGALLSKSELLELYQKNYQRDVRLASTKQGVHRDDLVFLLDSGYGLRPARHTASQGQVRSIALSLKLSSVEYLFNKTSELPVILLDDVESELDSARKRAFYELLSTKENQVIITATEVSEAFKSCFSEAGIQRVSVGQITS